MKLLQILFYVFVFFYLLQWAVRAVLRWKIRSFQNEMARKAAKTSANRSRRTPKEGEIRVDTGAARGRKINERIGDYIEYEELEAVEQSDETRP